MASVTLKNLSKSYPGPKKSLVPAVRHIDLEVRDGEFMVLVGPSGCGKTTTLRMIAGLEEVDEGSIAMDGKLIDGLHPKDRDVAMVFQHYALYPHLNVYDNMALGLKLRKFPKPEIRSRVEEAAQMLHITPLLERMPHQCSGGQRQRVAVGRALVRRPKVFLFDEPLSNLDAQMRLQMRLELRELHQKMGATMIYVTHDQAEAMAMGDRMVVMKEGTIQQLDTPSQVYDKPANAFVAGFIGAPAMNLLPAALVKGLALPSGSPIEGDETDGSLLAGFRPERALITIEIDGEKHDEGEGWLKAQVAWVEPTGADTFIHLRCDDHSLVVRSSPNHRLEKGQEVTVRIPQAAIRWFRSKDGLSVA